MVCPNREGVVPKLNGVEVAGGLLACVRDWPKSDVVVVLKGEAVAAVTAGWLLV